MKYIPLCLAILTVSATITSCSDQPAATETPKEAVVSIKEETVNYTSDTANMIGFVAYNEADSAKRPAVLVIPEWWGLTTTPNART